MTKKITKAERIFNKTYFASKRYIEHEGFEEGQRWSSLNTDETLYSVTLNRIEDAIDRQARLLDDFENHGIRTAEENVEWRQALQMVRNTLEREREKLAIDNAYMNGKISFDEYMAKAF